MIYKTPLTTQTTLLTIGSNSVIKFPEANIKALQSMYIRVPILI
ncbi:hypothetical protein ACFSTE_16675 [Aquimarina hainanensis]|uniref:Uncharacterized protein n=1 Tax=Aquimarina hainanensis TaxID=1578017 RepID=A0ABW5NBV0_9FLAO|nr:hypothetical protein [Aquimarina sp. TRL1]